MIGTQPIGATWIGTADGRQLFAQELGDGVPTVIFEAGMGASRNSWGAVADQIAERTSVLLYDRSGLGRSEPETERRSLDRLADDLVAVIDHVATGPVILVGHSWGGPIVRVAASRRPDRTVGVVLVDPTDEGCEVFFSKGNARVARISSAVMPLLARLGIIRRVAGKLAADLPEPWATAMREEDGTPQAVAEQLAELATSTDDLRHLRAEPLPTPTHPVTVISGLKSSKLERGRRGEVLEAHRARAATGEGGRWVGAAESGHYIPLTEPDLVAAEIHRLLDEHAQPVGEPARPTGSTPDPTSTTTIATTPEEHP